MDEILVDLIKCSTDFLILLVKEYENGKIDHEMFYSCAKVKVIFLKTHLNETETPELFALANQVIQKCNQINSCRKSLSCIY